ncbi:MAG: acyltransferase family protein [Candidatus Thorarchaeota archaeon]
MEKKQISELLITETDNEILERNTKEFFQVDFLKAAMIFLVIFDHMVSWGIKSDIGVALWERISIPVFLVIMGFNMGISFQRKGDLSLKKLYSWSYFKSKILRYIFPFLVLYGFSTLLGLILYQFNISEMYHRQYYPSHGFINLFIGILPFWGPGNWFIPLVFQSILILPLLYKALTKKPILTLILCFIIEIAMQLVIFFFIGNLYPGGVISWPKVHILNIFMTSILFYLPAIGLGMWFSFGYKLEQNRNFFMWIIYPISLAFICAHQFFGFRIMIGELPLLRGDYHFLIVPYSAFLFLLAMKFLPQNSDNKFSQVISLIGKSTYHILLTQILGYGIIYALRGTHYLIDVGFTFLDALNLIYAWLIFISFGILWFKIDQEKNLIRRLLYYINFFLIFSVIIFFIFETLIPPEFDWVPLPLIIILIYAVIGLTISFATKKPIRTTTIALWTSFLVYNFLITILYIDILPSTEYLIQNISISIFFVLVVIGTVLDYIFRK